MFNMVAFYIPKRFQKRLLCQEPLVIISNELNHKRCGVCWQLGWQHYYSVSIWNGEAEKSIWVHADFELRFAFIFEKVRLFPKATVSTSSRWWNAWRNMAQFVLSYWIQVDFFFFFFQTVNDQNI